MTAVEGQPAGLSKSSQEAYTSYLSTSHQLQFPSSYINGCMSDHRGNSVFPSVEQEQGHSVGLLNPLGLKGH